MNAGRQEGFEHTLNAHAEHHQSHQGAKGRRMEGVIGGPAGDARTLLHRHSSSPGGLTRACGLHGAGVKRWTGGQAAGSAGWLVAAGSHQPTSRRRRWKGRRDLL